MSTVKCCPRTKYLCMKVWWCGVWYFGVQSSSEPLRPPPLLRGCHKDAHPFFLFFFLLWHPLSDVWWLPTNRHRLPTNRHWLPTNRHRLTTNRHRLPTNRHRLPTNHHRLHTNRHRLPTNRHRLTTNRHWLHTNRHRLPTGRHRRAYWTLRVFFFFHYGTPCPSSINWAILTLAPSVQVD